MNLGIDIDDTLTETSEFLLPYVAEYFSLDLETLKKDNINYDHLPDEYSGREKEFGKAMYAKVLLDVKLKRNAKEIVNKLKEEGHKIIIITARDETIYDDPFGFTTKQLEKLGIKYDKLVCSFDKRKVCIDEKIDVFVDDSIENLTSSEDVVGKILLFNSKLNMKKQTNFTRVDSWEEVYNYINDYKNTPI